MAHKEELIDAFDVLLNHCASKNGVCTDCELRFTCCKHIKTSVFNMSLTAQLELADVKDD